MNVFIIIECEIKTINHIFNIADWRSQFKKLADEDSFKTQYDYNSIMHDGKSAGAIAKDLITIETNNRAYQAGQHLTFYNQYFMKDILKICQQGFKKS